MSKKDKSEDVGDNGGKRKWSFLNFYDVDSCEDDEDDDKASKSKVNTDWSLSKVFSFFQDLTESKSASPVKVTPDKVTPAKNATKRKEATSVDLVSPTKDIKNFRMLGTSPLVLSNRGKQLFSDSNGYMYTIDKTRTSENSSGQQFFYYKCRHTFCSGRYHKTVQKNQDVDYVIAEELTSPHDPECDPADFAKKERIKKFKSQLFSKVVDYKATLGAAYGTTVNELIVDLTGNENQQDYCRLLTS